MMDLKDIFRLQQIFTVMQESDNAQLIIRSSAHTGILPIIEDGEVKKVTLAENAVLQDEIPDSVNERSRGRKTEKAEFGLMNEKQINRVKEGCCALCGTKLPSNK